MPSPTTPAPNAQKPTLGAGVAQAHSVGARLNEWRSIETSAPHSHPIGPRKTWSPTFAPFHSTQRQRLGTPPSKRRTLVSCSICLGADYHRPLGEDAAKFTALLGRPLPRLQLLHGESRRSDATAATLNLPPDMAGKTPTCSCFGGENRLRLVDRAGRWSRLSHRRL